MGRGNLQRLHRGCLATCLFLTPCYAFSNLHRCRVLLLEALDASRSSVWVQDAEDGFVDHENLEEEEVCIRSVKAFAAIASSIDNDHDDDEEDTLFLSAGALVQRPNGVICDAWTADSLEANSNLQFQGAELVLDELLWTHLQHQTIQLLPSTTPLDALFRFRLQCGSLESDYTCASYMAALSRGFIPMHEYTEEANDNAVSTYFLSLLRQNQDTGDDDMSGMVLDPKLGIQRYQNILSNTASGSNERASKILDFLLRVKVDESQVRKKGSIAKSGHNDGPELPYGNKLEERSRHDDNGSISSQVVRSYLKKKARGS